LVTHPVGIALAASAYSRSVAQGINAFPGFFNPGG
jgi:hypothetical protein